MKIPRLFPLYCVLMLSAFAGSPVRAAEPLSREVEAILFWNEEALKVIRLARTPPPLAALHLASLHAALHDTVNGLEPRFASYVDHGPPAGEGAQLEVAIAASARAILEALWGQAANPENFRLAYEQALRDVPPGPAREAGEAWGRRVAQGIVAARANAMPTGVVPFVPEPVPGRWRPTPPQFRPAVLPQVGKIRPFVVESAEAFRAPPPPAHDSPEALADLEIVRRLGRRDFAERTAQQTGDAPFFSDDLGTYTPPGRWNAIAQRAVRELGGDVHEVARLLALMNLAMADAGIVCWESKYHYLTWRPETALREGVRGPEGAWRLEPEPDWIPLMASPAHPDYVSGHGTFSGAAARVLMRVLGRDDVTFTMDSDGLPGAVRTYTSFSACAAAIADSRLFGGIHTPMANSAALTLGATVADAVIDRVLQPSTLAQR